jgi:hypothetical protein
MSWAKSWANTTPTAHALGAKAGPKVIWANAFSLENETGKTRAELSVHKDGPGLTLFSPSGKLRAVLAAHDIGAALVLADENDQDRVFVAILKSGPTLVLRDENDKDRVVLITREPEPRCPMCGFRESLD